MLYSIIQLAGLLRKAGIRVSHSEIRDFMEALSYTGVDREGFAWAVEATLVKGEKSAAALKILELFLADAVDKQLKEYCRRPQQKETPRLSRQEFLNRLHTLKNYIRDQRMLLKEGSLTGNQDGGSRIMGGRIESAAYEPERNSGEAFVAMISEGNIEKMLQFAREAVNLLEDGQCDGKDFIKRLKVASGWAEGEEILERMAAAGEGPDRWTAEERIHQFAGLAAEARDRMIWKKNPEEMLGQKNVSLISFNRLDYDESMEIKRKLVLLARRLASRKGYRYRAARRGQVDLRKTASLAGLYGGIPLKLLKRDRIPSKPEIIILCDLSGSVANFSRFMMLLVSAMHDRFRSVRTFAFVEGIEEVSGLIRGWDAQQKIARILRETRIWQTGFSDYGAVWRIFEESFIHLVNRKTNLIILGDARNNYKPDGLDHFINIAAGARRVFWLNPVPAREWDREDSIISRYAPFCHSVLECRNLQHLEKLARNVFN